MLTGREEDQFQGRGIAEWGLTGLPSSRWLPAFLRTEEGIGK